jgi:hypothetical protein
MATKKAAESTLYHLSPKGFWKKFREFSTNFVPLPPLTSSSQATLSSSTQKFPLVSPWQISIVGPHQPLVRKSTLPLPPKVLFFFFFCILFAHFSFRSFRPCRESILETRCSTCISTALRRHSVRTLFLANRTFFASSSVCLHQRLSYPSAYAPLQRSAC